jgi:hypothetical protein
MLQDLSDALHMLIKIPVSDAHRSMRPSAWLSACRQDSTRVDFEPTLE